MQTSVANTLVIHSSAGRWEGHLRGGTGVQGRRAFKCDKAQRNGMEWDHIAEQRIVTRIQRLCRFRTSWSYRHLVAGVRIEECLVLRLRRHIGLLWDVSLVNCLCGLDDIVELACGLGRRDLASVMAL